MATKAEDAAGGGDMKTFYSVTKQLCNENKPQGNIIRDKNNNPLTEDKLLNELLNCEPPVTCASEPEVPVKELIDIAIDQITRFEIF